MLTIMEAESGVRSVTHAAVQSCEVDVQTMRLKNRPLIERV